MHPSISLHVYRPNRLSHYSPFAIPYTFQHVYQATDYPPNCVLGRPYTHPPLYLHTHKSAQQSIRLTVCLLLSLPTRLSAYASIHAPIYPASPSIRLTLYPLACVCTNPTVRQPISLPTRLSAYNIFLQRSTFQHFYPPNPLSTHPFIPLLVYPLTRISAHTSTHIRFYPPTPLLSRLTVYRATRLSAYASFTPSFRLPVHSPTRVSAYASIRPPV